MTSTYLELGDAGGGSNGCFSICGSRQASSKSSHGIHILFAPANSRDQSGVLPTQIRNSTTATNKSRDTNNDFMSGLIQVFHKIKQLRLENNVRKNFSKRSQNSLQVSNSLQTALLFSVASLIPQGQPQRQEAKHVSVLTQVKFLLLLEILYQNGQPVL